MGERIGNCTYLPTGTRLTYLFKWSWRTKYYSFDWGKTWSKSKLKAFNSAGGLGAAMKEERRKKMGKPTSEYDTRFHGKGRKEKE